MNNKEIKEKLSLYLGSAMNNNVNDEITMKEFIEDLIELNVFCNEKDIMFFIMESLYESMGNFETQYPIKYYNSKEEFYNDEYSVDDSDIEHLNEEFVSNMKATE